MNALLNDFLNSLLQYVITGAFATLCVFIGVGVRKAADKRKHA